MILLITSSIADENNGGGELYTQFHRCLLGRKVFRLGVTVNSVKVKPTLSGFQFVTLFRNDRIWKKIINKLFLITPIYFFIRYLLVRHRIKRLVKFLNPDKIIISLRSEVLIVACDILLDLKIPTYGMVEDTVERERDGSLILYWIKRYCYYKLIPKCQNIGVASENMLQYVKDRFNINSIILRPSYDLNFTADSISKRSQCIKILFAGSLYAKETLVAFIKALDVWCFKNTEVYFELYIASHVFMRSSTKHLRVTNLGWLDKEDLLSMSKTMDFGYVPYSFKKEQKHAMSFAFPAKLGFYLSVGLPVILHGPWYSSLHSFNEQNQVGLSITTLNGDDIIKILEGIFVNRDGDKSLQYNARKCFLDKFTVDVFDKNFREFIN